MKRLFEINILYHLIANFIGMIKIGSKLIKICKVDLRTGKFQQLFSVALRPEIDEMFRIFETWL